MAKIDLKNRKILYELDVNSRQSFQSIAKKVGLSKDAVIYRIKNLQEAGIIKGFHTVLDNGKLGFIPFRLYLRLQNTTPEKEQELIDYFMQQKEVIWLMSIEGEYSIGLATYVKSIKEMNDFWKKLFSRYRNYIDKRWLTIYTRVAYYPRAFFIGAKQNSAEFVCFTQPDELDVAELELGILKLLSQNSRLPVIEIAKKLKITPKTVSKKIKELEKNKIIAGYRTMFDLEKLGYQYFKVHINVKDMDEKKEKMIKSFLRQHPNIVYDNEILGGYDLEIEIQVPSLNDLRKVLNEMKEQFPGIIKNYTYMLFYKEHKYVFFPV
ncbi:Lrp/AsnC family transcriptional regulator [Candidatus Woesearchaeota archaeon]|nr:Lrp/AsnC family transcriptional regulator [Candidatus Woesearchaeota archaeon]